MSNKQAHKKNRANGWGKKAYQVSENLRRRYKGKIIIQIQLEFGKQHFFRGPRIYLFETANQVADGQIVSSRAV